MISFNKFIVSLYNFINSFQFLFYMVLKVPKDISQIVLSKEGTWFQKGGEVTHERIIDYYIKRIRYDEDTKEYYLQQIHGNKEQHVYFEVEETAYFVESVDFKVSHITLHLNDRTSEILDQKKLVIIDDVCYSLVKEDDLARFHRSAHQELLEKIDDTTGKYLIHLDLAVIDLSSLKE